MTVTGITPVVINDSFFVLDKSGTFTLDTSVWANVFLVGGGCDGNDGHYDADREIAFGGDGGDGGYVYKFGKIALLKDTEYTAEIAEPNVKNGTSLSIQGVKYTCGDIGKQSRKGGAGSAVNSQRAVINARNGADGVLTPFGYVGSSGGGGCTVYGSTSAAFGKGGVGAGNGRGNVCKVAPEIVKDNIAGQINAKSYGCGGGGNVFSYNYTSFEDIGLKSKGKGGCIIVVYEPYDDKFPEVTARYWKSVVAARAADSADENLKSLRERYLAILAQNDKLKSEVEQIEE